MPSNIDKAVPSSEGSIPSALKNFSNLPDDAFVRLPVVAALYSVSSSTVWRMVRAGKIPCPKRHFSRVTAWNVGELRAALGGHHV